MGQHFSKQYYPDLPQPRRHHGERRSRPFEREERRIPHHEFTASNEVAELQRQAERRSRRHKGDPGNNKASRASRDQNEDTSTVSVKAQSSVVDKAISTRRSRRATDHHDRRHHHRTHDDSQHDIENVNQPQDSACDTSDPLAPFFDDPVTSSSSTRQCPICTTTRSISRFPRRLPTSACKHEASACRRCLRRWLEAQFETKEWNELKCPMCPAVLLYSDVKEFAPRDMFRRYEHQVTKPEYEKIPGWTWCLAADCLAGQVHDARKAKFRCKTCEHQRCVKCDVKWHKGETCKEYEKRALRLTKRRTEDSASEKLIAATTKPCPSCFRPIEKVDGCDHMTCVKCKHQFCWCCLAAYTSRKGVLRIEHVPGCLSMY